MKRTRARLDLLPLLDVFMVVLFVFATIQEQRLDTTTQEVQEHRELAATLEAQLDRARSDLAHQASTSAPPEDSREIETLRERLRQREETIAELRTDVEKTLGALATGDDAVRQRDVLVKLLDRYSVFEIEIAGDIDESGAVVNHCCFRDDPLASTWQPCGAIPVLGEQRASWLDDGAGGLAGALRRTKGGNAMTIVRQDERASYRIAASLEGMLRERFPEHQIYDEGVGLVEIRCGPAHRSASGP